MIPSSDIGTRVSFLPSSSDLSLVLGGSVGVRVGVPDRNLLHTSGASARWDNAYRREIDSLSTESGYVGSLQTTTQPVNVIQGDEANRSTLRANARTDPAAGSDTSLNTEPRSQPRLGSYVQRSINDSSLPAANGNQTRVSVTFDLVGTDLRSRTPISAQMASSKKPQLAQYSLAPRAKETPISDSYGSKRRHAVLSEEDSSARFGLRGNSIDPISTPIDITTRESSSKVPFMSTASFSLEQQSVEADDYSKAVSSVKMQTEGSAKGALAESVGVAVTQRNLFSKSYIDQVSPLSHSSNVDVNPLDFPAELSVVTHGDRSSPRVDSNDDGPVSPNVSAQSFPCDSVGVFKMNSQSTTSPSLAQVHEGPQSFVVMSSKISNGTNSTDAERGLTVHPHAQFATTSQNADIALTNGISSKAVFKSIEGADSSKTSKGLERIPGSTEKFEGKLQKASQASPQSAAAGIQERSLTGPDGLTVFAGLGGTADSHIELTNAHGQLTYAGPSTTNPFDSLDARAGAVGAEAVSSNSTGQSVGARGIEVGYQDRTLGYVELRASMRSGAVHATLVAQSAASGEVLSSHLGSLNAWLKNERTPVESLTVHADLKNESYGAPAGRGGERGSEENHNTRQEESFGPQMTSSAVRSAVTNMSPVPVPTVTAMPLGSSISVLV